MTTAALPQTTAKPEAKGPERVIGKRPGGDSTERKWRGTPNSARMREREVGGFPGGDAAGDFGDALETGTLQEARGN